MSPTASSTSIAPAQQPVHHMPLPMPVRNAPVSPSLHPCTMRANGAHTCLVSGGFTLFTDRIAAMSGFDGARANRLTLTGGNKLDGRVAEPIFGRDGKRATLLELRQTFALQKEETMAVGDGANDLDMIVEAGLGVAYRAKPKVAEAAAARIDHADLTALLYAQGYRRAEFVEA